MRDQEKAAVFQEGSETNEETNDNGPSKGKVFSLVSRNPRVNKCENKWIPKVATRRQLAFHNPRQWRWHLSTGNYTPVWPCKTNSSTRLIRLFCSGVALALQTSPLRLQALDVQKSSDRCDQNQQQTNKGTSGYPPICGCSRQICVLCYLK